MRLKTHVGIAIALATVCACQTAQRSLEDPSRTEFKAAPARALGPYSSWERQTEGRIGEDLFATPLPSGGGIIFASNRHSESYKLYFRDFRGKRIRRLTHGPGDDAFPAVSPDESRIAFSSTRQGPWQLYLQTGFEDRQPVRIGEPGVEARHPAWSPDGKQLAYCRLSPVSQEWEIWLIDLATQTQSRVTEGLFPVFSPNGETLAFQRHRRRDNQWFSIWTIRLDGTHEHEIVSGDSWGAVNPCWSPDGTWIIFNSVGRTESGSESETGTDLFTVRLDGTQLRRLTFKPGPEWNPFWGLDSRVYFSAIVDGQSALWSIEAPKHK